jgi:hypothetical protein
MKRSFDVATMNATVIDEIDEGRMKEQEAAAAEQSGSSNNPRDDDGRHPDEDEPALEA